MLVEKLNSENYAKVEGINGIIMEYSGKDGKNTAIIFIGEEFAVTAKNQKEFMRVIRNLMTLHWKVKDAEGKFREHNDGIRTILRATTPAKIKLFNTDGQLVKTYDLSTSVWGRIGLMPTKKDLERLEKKRDRAKYINKAAQKTLEALNFRMEIPKEEDLDIQITDTQQAGQEIADAIKETLEAVA